MLQDIPQQNGFQPRTSHELMFDIFFVELVGDELQTRQTAEYHAADLAFFVSIKIFRQTFKPPMHRAHARILTYIVVCKV